MALELQNVQRAYNGRIVLDIPSLRIEHGGRVALVGPNGSGKTTLLTIAAMLMRPDRGDVLVNGERVRWRFPEEHRPYVAFMAQEPFFFRGSLLKNMSFALEGSVLSRKARAERIRKQLSMLGVHDLAGRSPRTFSSGERKRAAIARALLREAPILLLDEPFSHIDATSAAVLEDVIGNLPRDRTLVFSTHDLSLAWRIADTVIALQNGRVAPCTPENLFRMVAHVTADGSELRSPGGIAIYYPERLEEGLSYWVMVNAREVLVTREPIESSARNNFRGAIRAIERAGANTVLLTADCRPDLPIRALLTERAIRDLSLNVGGEIWVHFKSTAVHAQAGM